jgi:uncharacterized protein YodC (DUF2158 family)
MEDRKIYFKEGDEVAHKENIELKMEVRRVIRIVKDEKKYIIGIECGWWEDSVYKKEKFHTSKLIPWSVAQQGYVSTVKWIENRNKIKA